MNITTAFIYKRTLTRPAVYFLFFGVPVATGEILLATSRVTTALPIRSDIIMLIAADSQMINAIIDDSTLIPDISDISIVTAAVPGRSDVADIITAISKVDG